MRTVSFLFLSAAFIATGWVTYANLLRTDSHRAVAQPIVHFPYDSAYIDTAIANSEQAVKIDPGGAMGWSTLGGDYLARSRESDDLATAVRAEKAARKSLSIRVLGNIGARNKLVSALLQQHRFKDALAVCLEARKANVYDDQTVRQQAECLVEIGQYDQALGVIKSSTRAFAGASGEAIVSRAEDINGNSDRALSLLKDAAFQADQAPAMPSDAIAWFHTRVGIQLAKMGRHDEARVEYFTALRLYPRDYKSMAGLAKVAFQDGRWQDAIEWGLKSDDIAQMADVRALVGDAYAMLNDPTKAEEQYAKVATLVGRPSGINSGLHEVAPAAGTHGHRLDRQYAIFCADHNRDTEGAYAAAIRDFEGRKDIYSYDTLAWVCLKAGNVDEAVKSIGIALARGTRDPLLYSHAGAIYAASGDNQRAEKYLAAALAIDPHFDGVAAARAQELLASVQGKVHSK